MNNVGSLPFNRYVAVRKTDPEYVNLKSIPNNQRNSVFVKEWKKLNNDEKSSYAPNNADNNSIQDAM